MDISNTDVQYLSSTLETHTVTYRTAARDLNIHVSKSKQMLYDYYNLNKSSVTASFVVTGTRRGNTIVQIFQTEEDFASQKNQFDDVRAVHVYCLTLAKNHPLASELAMADQKSVVDLADLKRYYKLGLTKGTDLANVEREDRKQLENAREQEPERKPHQTTSTAPKAAAKPKLEYQSRKEKAKTPSLLSNYVSRKAEAKAAIPTKREASTPSYQYKSRKVEQSQPKERVVMSSVADDNDDMDVDSASKASGGPQGSTDLNNLFLDELSDFSDDTKDDAEEEPIVVENEEPTTETKDTVHQAQVPDDSIFRTMVNKSASPAPQPPSPTPVTTVDDDGYITTYKAKEPKETKETKRAPARAQTSKPKAEKKGDGKKKQASLMSFFGKR